MTSSSVMSAMPKRSVFLADFVFSLLPMVLLWSFSSVSSLYEFGFQAYFDESVIDLFAAALLVLSSILASPARVAAK